MKLATCRLALFFAFVVAAAIPAQATLTVTPITWNVVGLDSNNPAAGPHLFPVGARVCSDVATTNVNVNFLFDTANANINLRPGSLSTINLPAIGAGQCADAYFEIDVTQTPAAFDTARRYHITATDVSGTASTPTPREIFVEHLVSQNRNSITDVKFGPVGGPYTSVPAGSSMSLVVGNTYDIQLLGGTATQGYNQFASFINFPNTIFQVLAVNTSYSADDSPYVPNPNDKLYADACKWENDPNSPNYRACVGGDFKAGGANVVTTYTIRIISGGGTSQTLGSLLYDFSGSSYHYNSDFGVSARIANIIDPASATIAKSFTPNPAALNGVSALTITLANPNTGALGGYNFVDNLPANLVIANPSGATTSGCGAPSLSAPSGGSTINFSNGTVAANGTCVITVKVTPSATGSLVNTTGHLFINTLDTTHFATATLTVNNAPPPGTGLCGLTFARWTFATGFNLASPAPSTLNVASAQAEPGPGLSSPTIQSANSTTTADGTSSWGSNGAITTGPALVTSNDDYFEFAINTTNVVSVTLSFDALFKTANGPTGLAVFHGAPKPAATNEPGPADFSNGAAITAQNTWQTFSGININSGLNPSGLTFFRIYSFNSNSTNAGADVNIDNVTFTGCVNPIQPTIGKAFAPNPIAVNAVSTLTFTLTNTNTPALTGAAFSDALPSGLQVAATPAAATTCGGTWTPAPGNTTLTFSGGTIPGSGSCTVQVNVIATTAGPHANVSSFVSTTEGGTNANSIASATLTAILPPSIAKQFGPNPILPNGISHLTFTITNPNQNDALNGVNFADNLPGSPAQMVVAAAPNPATSGCGSPTFNPAPGASSFTFTGGVIAPGGQCIVTVDVTAPAAGTYNNTSSPVSHTINAQQVNGNTASGSLTVNPPSPSIHLSKQVGPANSGPFFPYIAVPVGAPVFYLFTVENTGNVPLTSPAITDSAVNVAACNAGWSGATLPVAVPGNDNHILTCVVGPITAVAGVNTNTANVSATFNGNPVASPPDSATYATTGMTLAKNATESTFTLPGDTLHYSYLVTNSGFAILNGPITVSDSKTTVTCPPVNSQGDNDNFFDPGESITCTATYVVTATDVANAGVTNTAQASSADGATSNTSSKTVPLSTSADVSIAKTLDTVGPYYTGQTISYTITVANAGPATATAIQVTDSPTNLAIQSVTGSGCGSFPCTIASLASATNTQISVTATITAAGAFDNSASATAAEPDPNSSNNTDNTNNGGTATDAADLQIVKTFVTQPPYRNSDVITLNLAVTNNGPSTATNVVVVDHPVGLTIQSMTGGNCTGAVINGNPNQNVQCTIASMSSGETQNVTVTAHLDNTGQFLNRGIVSADQTDPNTNNNQSDAVDVATASADVSIVKTLDTAGPYYPGQSIQYTLTVHNAGPSPAGFVVVNDTPTNLTITNVTGANCSSLPCQMSNPPFMVIGNTRTITVTATINSAGAFDNAATANGNDFDPDTSNNTDNTNNGGTAVTTADVAMSKVLVTTGPYSQGQSITYTLTVTNSGPNTATNIQVTDTPTNLTITNVSGSGASSSCTSLPCTIGSLATGNNTTITVTATIVATGVFDNSATATPSELDPDQSNNTDASNNGSTAGLIADVSIVKAFVTPQPYRNADNITMTLQVSNAGPNPATNVVVNDTSVGLTVTNMTGGNCNGLTISPTGNGSIAQCTIASLGVGASVTITVTAHINFSGQFLNTGTATPAEFDPDASNNTSSINAVATASADLSVVKTLLTNGPFYVGQSIQYTVAVHNAGPSPSVIPVLSDTPSNLTITSVSGPGCSSFPCTLIPALLLGQTRTYTVTATINAVGPFDNSATITGRDFDPDTTNNTDNVGNGGTALPSADVSMVKTLTSLPPFILGQSVSYTLVVANAGPSPATSIQVTDTPTHLTITNVSGSGCSSLPCTIPSLASGANTTINVTATINAAGTFDNSATATAAEFDPNTANNTDNTGNSGSTTQAGIPTLSEYALMILALLLACIGMMIVRRT